MWIDSNVRVVMRIMFLLMCLSAFSCSSSSDSDGSDVTVGPNPETSSFDGVITTDSDGMAAAELGTELFEIYVFDQTTDEAVSGVDLRYVTVNDEIYIWTESDSYQFASALVPLNGERELQPRVIPLLALGVLAVNTGFAIYELTTDPPAFRTTDENGNPLVNADGYQVRCLVYDVNDMLAILGTASLPAKGPGVLRLLRSPNDTRAAAAYGLDRNLLYEQSASRVVSDFTNTYNLDDPLARDRYLFCNPVVGETNIPTIELLAYLPDEAIAEMQNDPSTTATPDVVASPTSTPVNVLWADPHLITLDGLSYDFQGVGEFRLLQSAQSGLEIQTRNQPYLGSSSVASVSTGFAFALDGDRVSFVRSANNELLTFVNGKEIVVNSEEELLGGGRIIRGNGTHEVVWKDGSMAVITDRQIYLDLALSLSERHKGRTVGLLGNFDSDMANDIATVDGRELGMTPHVSDIYGDFSSGWRVNDGTSLFHYFDGQDATTFANPFFPTSIFDISDLEQDALDRARRVCEAANVQVFFDQCVMDVGILSDLSLAVLTANSSAITENQPRNSLEPAAVEGSLQGGEPSTDEEVVFREYFDDEAQAEGTFFDYNGFSEMVVVEGSVDLISNGSFNISCSNDSGGCIELDGSYSVGQDPTSVIRSRRSLALQPGEYVLYFDLSGDTRGDFGDTVVVEIENILVKKFDLQGREPLRRRRISFEINRTIETNVFFTLEGVNNDVGPTLDSILLVQSL